MARGVASALPLTLRHTPSFTGPLHSPWRSFFGRLRRVKPVGWGKILTDMVEEHPIKQSVSLAVFAREIPGGSDGPVILVRRPEQDEDFPGMWGLPAASCLLGETPEEAAERAGLQKLGAPIEALEPLVSGEQQRPGYTLKMTLYGARLAGPEPSLEGQRNDPSGLTFYTEWRWGWPGELRESAQLGSLCCRLLLDWCQRTI